MSPWTSIIAYFIKATQRDTSKRTQLFIYAFNLIYNSFSVNTPFFKYHNFLFADFYKDRMMIIYTIRMLNIDVCNNRSLYNLSSHAEPAKQVQFILIFKNF
jgi:hypothetical protein